MEVITQNNINDVIKSSLEVTESLILSVANVVATIAKNKNVKELENNSKILKKINSLVLSYTSLSSDIIKSFCTNIPLKDGENLSNLLGRIEEIDNKDAKKKIVKYTVIDSIMQISNIVNETIKLLDDLSKNDFSSKQSKRIKQNIKVLSSSVTAIATELIKSFTDIAKISGINDVISVLIKQPDTTVKMLEQDIDKDTNNVIKTKSKDIITGGKLGLFDVIAKTFGIIGSFSTLEAPNLIILKLQIIRLKRALTDITNTLLSFNKNIIDKNSLESINNLGIAIVGSTDENGNRKTHGIFTIVQRISSLLETIIKIELPRKAAKRLKRALYIFKNFINDITDILTDPKIEIIASNETNKRLFNINNIINKLSDVFNTITGIILKSLLIKYGKKIIITAISNIISIIDELEKLNDKKLNENTVTLIDTLTDVIDSIKKLMVSLSSMILLSISGVIGLVMTIIFVATLVVLLRWTRVLFILATKSINQVDKGINSILNLIKSLLIIGAAILLFAIATPLFYEAIKDYIAPFLWFLVGSIVILGVVMFITSKITKEAAENSLKIALCVLIISGAILIAELCLLAASKVGSKLQEENAVTNILFGLGAVSIFSLAIIGLGSLLNKLKAKIITIDVTLILLITVIGLVTLCTLLLLPLMYVGQKISSWENIGYIGLALLAVTVFSAAVIGLGALLGLAAPLLATAAGTIVPLLIVLGLITVCVIALLPLSKYGETLSNNDVISNISYIIGAIAAIGGELILLSLEMLLVGPACLSLLATLSPMLFAIKNIDNIVTTLNRISNVDIKQAEIKNKLSEIKTVISLILEDVYKILYGDSDNKQNQNVIKQIKKSNTKDSGTVISTIINKLNSIIDSISHIKTMELDSVGILKTIDTIFDVIAKIDVHITGSIKNVSALSKSQRKTQEKSLNHISDIMEPLNNIVTTINGIKDIKITEDVKKNVLNSIDEIFDFTKELSQKVQELFDPKKEYTDKVIGKTFWTNKKIYEQTAESLAKQNTADYLKSDEFADSVEHFGAIGNVVTTLRNMTDSLKAIINFKVDNKEKETIENNIDELFGLTNTIANKLNSYSKDTITADTTKLTDYTSTLNEFGKSFNAISGVDTNKFNANTNSFAKFLSVVNKVELDKVKSAADMFEKMSEFSSSIQGNFDKLADALSEKLLPVLEDLKEVMSEVPDKLDKGFSNTSASIGAINNAPTRDNYTAQVLREQPNLSKQQVESLVDARLNDKAKADANSMSAKLDDLISLLKGMTGENVVVKMA